MGGGRVTLTGYERLAGLDAGGGGAAAAGVMAAAPGTLRRSTVRWVWVGGGRSWVNQKAVCRRSVPSVPECEQPGSRHCPGASGAQ